MTTTPSPTMPASWSANSLLRKPRTVTKNLGGKQRKPQLERNIMKWPHKCTGWKASESDPSFCANCGNIASGHKGPTPGAPRQYQRAVMKIFTERDNLMKRLAQS